VLLLPEPELLRELPPVRVLLREPLLPVLRLRRAPRRRRHTACCSL
jgi:hypothetical protein